MTHAKHIQSTDDRKVLAYGRVPSRPARHRELPTHVRDAVAWWTRTHYRLLRDEGVDRATARFVVRTYAHCAFLGGHR